MFSSTLANGHICHVLPSYTKDYRFIIWETENRLAFHLYYKNIKLNNKISIICKNKKIKVYRFNDNKIISLDLNLGIVLKFINYSLIKIQSDLLKRNSIHSSINKLVYYKLTYWGFKIPRESFRHRLPNADYLARMLRHAIYPLSKNDLGLKIPPLLSNSLRKSRSYKELTRKIYQTYSTELENKVINSDLSILEYHYFLTRLDLYDQLNYISLYDRNNNSLFVLFEYCKTLTQKKNLLWLLKQLSKKDRINFFDPVSRKLKNRANSYLPSELFIDVITRMSNPVYKSLIKMNLETTDYNKFEYELVRLFRRLDNVYKTHFINF